MTEAMSFNVQEAAFVVRVRVSWAEREFQTDPVFARRVARGNAMVRAVGTDDLLFLMAVRSLGSRLKLRVRDAIYEAVKSVPVEQVPDLHFRRFDVNIARLRAQMFLRIAAMRELERKVETSAAGEVVLKDTNIEVYRIAFYLLGGLTPAEIGAVYPSVTDEEVAIAKAYARLHPVPRRSY